MCQAGVDWKDDRINDFNVYFVNIYLCLPTCIHVPMCECMYLYRCERQLLVRNAIHFFFFLI